MLQLTELGDDEADLHPAPLAVAAAGLLVVVVYRWLAALRLFFNVLFPALFVVDGAFLASPTISPLLTTSASTSIELGDVEIENPLPLVLVVFDELPLASLLNRDGGIDSSRFPNFSALARESTWYRRANVVANITQFSLPAILTNRLAGSGALASTTNPVRAPNQNETNSRPESLRYGGSEFDGFDSGAHHSMDSAGRPNAATARQTTFHQSLTPDLSRTARSASTWTGPVLHCSPWGRSHPSRGAAFSFRLVSLALLGKSSKSKVQR